MSDVIKDEQKELTINNSIIIINNSFGFTVLDDEDIRNIKMNLKLDNLNTVYTYDYLLFIFNYLNEKVRSRIEEFIDFISNLTFLELIKFSNILYDIDINIDTRCLCPITSLNVLPLTDSFLSVTRLGYLKKIKDVHLTNTNDDDKEDMESKIKSYFNENLCLNNKYFYFFVLAMDRYKKENTSDIIS